MQRSDNTNSHKYAIQNKTDDPNNPLSNLRLKAFKKKPLYGLMFMDRDFQQLESEIFSDCQWVI